METTASPAGDPVELLYTRNRHHDLVDSLSFVDAIPVELEGDIRELIACEKRAILEEFGGDEEALLSSYVASLPPTPDHTASGFLYSAEVSRKADGMSIDGLDLNRYVGYGEDSDLAARLDHMMMLWEYAQGAQVNLELMDRYKEAAWLKHLEDLTKLHSSLDKIKTRLTSEMEQLNKERKLSHIEWANRLRSISQEYEDYRVKNKQLLLAIEKLQNSSQAVPLGD
ncbi:hypothetical protein X943_000151 [Babesia divergens]|uniref:Pre-mRNA-splicing factor SPF27 n=1 Tax=Babesia divergens TaxID=32595 RepID=A0AAD9GET7_BABDI|nr:hypothetical protein X943_000151 [Babesia divergens]